MKPSEPTREELIAVIHSLIHQGSVLHNDVFRKDEESATASGWRFLVKGVQRATSLDYGVQSGYYSEIEFKKKRTDKG